MAENFQLKNIINDALVKTMSKNLHAAWNQFDRQEFEMTIITQLDQLELKARSKLICHTLNTHLPMPFSDATIVLLNAFEKDEKSVKELGKYASFYYMPFGEYVAQHGLEYFELSMHLLKTITKRFTAEFAIRPFIQRYPKKTLKTLNDWALDDDEHVRRLASEGTRPRLPWASRLPEFQRDPMPVISLLQKLRADPSLYVRRSVANNLNDIAKDNPEEVLKLLQNWQSNASSETKWIIKHASRTLIKDGHKQALLLHGYDSNTPFNIANFSCTKVVHFGESLNFSFLLTNLSSHEASFVIDYVMYFKKANGKLSPKVFKITQKQIKPNAQIKLLKSHPLKPITTRSYYPGEQAIALKINGNELNPISFELEMDSHLVS